MIIAAGYVVVIAVALAVIWTMQRRFMYFPTGDVPTPGEIGLTHVEEVTFQTIDGLGPVSYTHLTLPTILRV